MKTRKLVPLVLAGLVLVVSAPSVLSAASADRVITEVILEVGHPAAGAVESPSAVIPPWTVVIYDSQGLSGAKRYIQLQKQLREAYRLETLSKEGNTMLDLVAGAAQAAPSPIPGLEIALKLLAVDDARATYEIRLAEADKTPVVTNVAVKRSDWAIVGGRDGARAPYFYVLFRPLSLAEEKEERGWEGMTKPKVATKVPPKYPEEARKAKVQDVIVLDLGISAGGAVTDAAVVEGEVAALVEAARQAALQWVFEPARDASGKAVACRYKITIAFKLE